jgi:hypothetical protein
MVVIEWLRAVRLNGRTALSHAVLCASSGAYVRIWLSRTSWPQASH